MAANNYYGYGYNANPNQYSTVTGSSGYATGMHAQHAVPAQSAYPPSQTTVQYGPYGTRNQVTTMPTAQGYGEVNDSYFGAVNAGDSYYSQKTKSQPASASYQSRSSYEQPYAAASGTQKVSSSEWQPAQGKQTYSQNYSSSHVPSQSNTSYTSSGYSYTTSSVTSQSPTTTSAAAASSGSYSGLDAAVYSAAANYLLQKQKGDKGSNWYKNFKGGRGPPDPSQWKYCELCKCTCAGLQAYKAHLVGKAHKKKEATGQSGVATNPAASKATLGNHLYCQLCDVVCSSSDAYAAHMRGSKHQRILKLQIKMGKPIPSRENPDNMATSSAEAKATMPPSAKILKTTTYAGTKKVFTTPKITFVGGTQLKTTGVKSEEVAMVEPGDGDGGEMHSDLQSADYDVEDKNAQPVGLEYIEESLNETRTAPNFYCKLCDCSFTDPLAKVMHTKGRRHRLQYKKKVDPSLKVDVKVSSYHSRAEMERIKRRIAVGDYWRKKELQDSYKLEAEDLRYEKELLQWQLEKTAMRFDSMSTSAAAAASAVASPEKSCFVEMGTKRDADHVNAKHTAIYPTEDDLTLVQVLVSSCERSLKLVSDHLATVKADRELKGVMRIGLLAKGLLLHDCLQFDLVVLCSFRPTQSLLKDIMDNLPEQLKTFTEDKFKLDLAKDSCGFTFTFDDDGEENEQKKNVMCTVTLTSPAVNPDSGSEPKTESENGVDGFDAKPCLKALAALRHAKWFQAKATNLYSCVVVIRLMMDFCKRVPTWSVVNQWSLELLVEKCISSESVKLGPAIGLRRVFEAVASGILLPGGTGVYDPCEKTPTDAFEYLSRQEREDLTNSAQHAVRMMAFGDIHKVLGMEALPSAANSKANKRKRASSS